MAAAAVALGLQASALRAQVDTVPVDPPAPAAAEPAAKEEPAEQGVLAEIVVTATKRAENARDIPATVQALSGEELEQKGVQGQEDFLKLVPGVTFSNDTINANRITFRGIGADLNTSNTTGVFLGDVPFDDPTLPRVTLDPNPFDLARIEILKGPQGTLFGGSALNGAVRYVPQDPVLGEWQAKTFAQMEAVHEGDVGPIYGGALNVPIGDSAALRIVGFNRHSPGWVDDHERDLDDVNKVHQHGGRAMALWEPSDAWKISAMAVAQKTDVLDSAITDNRDGDLSRSDTPQASPISTRYDLETLGVQYSFPTFDVLSQSSRTSKHFNATVDASRIGNLPHPPPTVTILTDNESHGLMQELRFTSNEGFEHGWKWLGGAFVRRVKMEEVTDLVAIDRSLPLPPGALAALSNLIPGLNGTITEEGKLNATRGQVDPITVTETALFGETTATFLDDLEVTLGARAFRAKSYSNVIFSGVLAVNQTLPQGQLYAVKEGTLIDKGINPKFAVKYTFNENVAAYGSVSKGFRFGGAQVLVGTLTSRAPDSYKSDTVWAYELGLRTQWLDNKLFADVTPFWTEWLHPQLQQADATGLGSYFDNVGGARSRGVELALRYLTPLPGLVLGFAGSYTDTVTTKPFTTSSGVDTEPGTRWPLSAKWQTATTVGYAHRLFGTWTGGGSVAYTTISTAPNTLAYLDTVFGYETLDVGLNLGNPAMPGAPELSLTLSNATDERGIISGVNNPQFAKDHNYIRPRTLVARFSLSF